MAENPDLTRMLQRLPYQGLLTFWRASYARDEKNDLAVVRSNSPISSVAVFRGGAPARAGDAVVALGYPLSGVLATTANLSVGNVSALAGLERFTLRQGALLIREHPEQPRR